MKFGEVLTKNKFGKYSVYSGKVVITINNLHSAIEYAKEFDATKVVDEKNKIVWKNPGSVK